MHLLDIFSRFSTEKPSETSVLLCGDSLVQEEPRGRTARNESQEEQREPLGRTARKSLCVCLVLVSYYLCTRCYHCAITVLSVCVWTCPKCSNSTRRSEKHFQWGESGCYSFSYSLCEQSWVAVVIGAPKIRSAAIVKRWPFASGRWLCGLSCFIVFEMFR